MIETSIREEKSPKIGRMKQIKIYSEFSRLISSISNQWGRMRVIQYTVLERVSGHLGKIILSHNSHQNNFHRDQPKS